MHPKQRSPGGQARIPGRPPGSAIRVRPASSTHSLPPAEHDYQMVWSWFILFDDSRLSSPEPPSSVRSFPYDFIQNIYDFDRHAVDPETTPWPLSICQPAFVDTPAARIDLKIYSTAHSVGIIL